jgi:FlaA1/EpsC-like NDP-sugar epimerase
MTTIFEQARILITGGTGSWGRTLTRLLLANYDVREIIIFSRGELQQVLMQRDFGFDTRIKFIIGDVRDYQAVTQACRNIDLIFHLAALKHVPICEDHPQEAIKTNITGTSNIVNAAIANSVKKVIDVSTDKAVEPLNLYGMTKSVGERLILQANDLDSSTQFICVRGGNVMGSNGSVIPFFIQEFKKGGRVRLTDPRMTRFFLTLEEAIHLLFRAAAKGQGKETFVMNMPSCKIVDLLEVLMDHYGHVETEIIGAKPGEKLHEVLVSRHESALTKRLDQDYYVIMPQSNNKNVLEHYRNLPDIAHSEFSSDTVLMNKEQIANMLAKGNFL